MKKVKKVIVVGGGFAGVAACKKLRGDPLCQIDLIDRNNYHLFQPLLYQVAMAGLNPSDIAVPLRRIFAKAGNILVRMAEVTQIDLEQQRICYDDKWHDYDYLVLACGAKHFYFGNDEWEQHAPGLKTIEQAIEIRRRILLAFEMADKTTDPQEQLQWLTFVVIGGGPTGVEMAGAIAEMASVSLKKDYHVADLSKTRVILVEAGPRVLPGFPASLSEKARQMLRSLGVEVRLERMAGELTETSVRLGEEVVEARTKIWAAGVHPSRLAQSVQSEKDSAGRLRVEPDLSLAGHANVFAVGDLSVFDHRLEQPLPGIAPVAIQQGAYVGNQIKRELRGKKRRRFSYQDKGMMATIGRSKAVVSSYGVKLSGFLAWLIWAFIHVIYLVEFRNRLLVFLHWAIAYFQFGRTARLIVRRGWRFYDRS